MFNLTEYLGERQQFINRGLDQHLPAPDARPPVLHEAMRYSVLAGGKRMRPILCLAAAELFGGSMEGALPAAVAIEFLHTYTLIHDDLPAMDNDDVRRGQPTSHKKYGEATAILAGDALLTLAFEVLAGVTTPAPYQPMELCRELARATGSQGVVGGQVADLAGATQTTVSPEDLAYVHQHKTAIFFAAAVRIGAMCGGCDTAGLAAMTSYGTNLGLAYQLIDDIHDAADETGGVSAVAVLGRARTEAQSRRHATIAINALKNLSGNTHALTGLLHYITDRTAD